MTGNLESDVAIKRREALSLKCAMQKKKGCVSTVNSAAMNSSEEARILRQVRQFRESFYMYLWGTYRDECDIFDLRYLFDEEEIQEHRQQLIEDEENWDGRIFHYDGQDEEEDLDFAPRDEDYESFDHGDENDVDMNNAELVVEEEENWDNDVYEVRFDMRLGFITDDYDSGYDEPNSRKVEYPPLVEEMTEEELKENEQLANLLMQLHFQRAHCIQDSS